MSSTRSYLGLVCVGALSLSAVVAADAGVVFQDDFEATTAVPGKPDAPQVGSYPVDASVDPEADVIVAGAGIDPASPDAGQNILKIVGKQRNYADPTLVAKTGDTITYEFDANHSFSEFTFGFAGDEGAISLDSNLLPVWLRVTESDIYYYNSGWNSTGIAPVLDTWMHIAITYTVGDSTFDLSVDSNSASGLSLTSATVPTEINRVKIMSGGSNSTVSYLDNPLVTSDSVGGLEGDLDGNGFVGVDDLNIVLVNWNQNVPPANAEADPSGDGFVGVDDLNIVLVNWNNGTPPAATTVPEPASMGVLGVMLALASHRRR